MLCHTVTVTSTPHHVVSRLRSSCDEHDCPCLACLLACPLLPCFCIPRKVSTAPRPLAWLRLAFLPHPASAASPNLYQVTLTPPPACLSSPPESKTFIRAYSSTPYTLTRTLTMTDALVSCVPTSKISIHADSATVDSTETSMTRSN